MEGLIWKEGKIVATVPLKPARVRRALPRKHTSFVIGPTRDQRTRGRTLRGERAQKPGWVSRKTTGKPELSTLTCNEELLREVAKLSGGTYLREEQIGRLNDLLKPISSGKLVTKEIALWQSYWWFVPIVLTWDLSFS